MSQSMMSMACLMSSADNRLTAIDGGMRQAGRAGGRGSEEADHLLDHRFIQLSSPLEPRNGNKPPLVEDGWRELRNSAGSRTRPGTNMLGIRRMPGDGKAERRLCSGGGVRTCVLAFHFLPVNPV